MTLETRNVGRRISTPGILVLSVLLGALASPAGALELSHYSPGMPNMHDYFLPPPEAGELIYDQYNLYYHSDTIRDRDGNEIKSITGPLGNTINLDVSIDQVVLAPAFMWAPKWNVLGGRYGAYIVIPVSNPSLEANLQTATGRGVGASTSVWDIGDIFVQPLWLMWSFPRAGKRPPIDLVAAYGLDAPTGRFHVNAFDNVGLGFWEHQIQTAARFTLDESNATSFVVANTIEIGQEKDDVDITPGAHESLNWAFGRHFFDHWFEAAVLGYDTFQISNDTGSAVSASSRGARDQVHAVGLQIGIPKLGMAFKYYRELGAADRFEGDVYTLNLALPLDPIVSKLEQVLCP